MNTSEAWTEILIEYYSICYVSWSNNVNIKLMILNQCINIFKKKRSNISAAKIKFISEWAIIIPYRYCLLKNLVWTSNSFYFIFVFPYKKLTRLKNNPSAIDFVPVFKGVEIIGNDLFEFVEKDTLKVMSRTNCLRPIALIGEPLISYTY